MSDDNMISVPRVRPAPPLDEEFYKLDADELAFFKSQTGINDDDALKAHIMRIQTEAYQIYPYSCIRRFAFTKLKISRLSAYPQLLKLGRDRVGAIFLDIGCCFGNDVRKAVADGFPAQNVIASDLFPEFWALGHQLFNTTPATFPVIFLPGNAFDHAHLQPSPPQTEFPSTPVPPLPTLASLNPLRGHVSAIHASAFFHLFGEAEQLQLARALAGLLSATPGSLIFGAHGGRAEKGLRTEVQRDGREPMFCHSPQSWIELWDGEVFKKGMVRVEAQLRPTEAQARSLLIWSVTRLIANAQTCSTE